MRLDHIAYRTKDRVATAQFFIDAFDYKIQTEFDLEFDDGSTTKCIALEPNEKKINVPFFDEVVGNFPSIVQHGSCTHIPGVLAFPYYHMAPEIFISDGSTDSIVGKWVAERGNIGGIHHLAYEVDNVTETMKKWQQNGWAEFASQKPLSCPGLTQIFTKPHHLTGVIYEFIKRDGEFGFCAQNVKNLMISTQELDLE